MTPPGDGGDQPPDPPHDTNDSLRGPDDSPSDADDASNPSDGYRSTSGADDDPMDWATFAYDVVSSAVAVLLVGALLFAVSGVWPPMVAVESPSMTPHMQTGDLVFVMEQERFPGEGAHGNTGVVTARAGANTSVDYRKFQRQGDVIVYRPRGANDTTPIIHRAMFWVDEGENWYDEADRQAVGSHSECGDTPEVAMPNCPAPHAGFITKGDANSRYDQVERMSGPVKPAWIVGTAEVRIPKLGCVRLRQEGCLTLTTGVGQAVGGVLDASVAPTPLSAEPPQAGGLPDRVLASAVGHPGISALPSRTPPENS